MQRWTAARDVLLLLTVALLPFDPPVAVVSLGGLDLTVGEFGLLAVAFAHVPRAINLWDRRQWPILAALAYLLGKGLIAAAFASPHEAAALKATLRLGVVLALIPAAADVAGQVRGAGRIMGSVVVGAVVAALLGGWEVLGQSDVVEGLLAIYRPKASIAAGGRRLTATFAHANLAAGYFAGALPVAVVLATRRHRSAATKVAAFGAVFTIAAALALTQSRGGLVAGWVAVAVVAALGTSMRASIARTAIVAGLGVCAAFAVGDGLASRWGLSSTTAYAASYDVPSQLNLEPGQRLSVPVNVTNRGDLTWRARGTDPVGLTWHMVAADTAAVVAVHKGWTPLPRPIATGETIRLEIPVVAPVKPGPYRLVIDLHHRGYADFSALGVVPAITRIKIPLGANAPPRTGLETSHPDAVIDDEQTRRAVLAARAQTGSPNHGREAARSDLWRAAAAMIVSSPLLGQGYNTFRLRWGASLPERRHDARTHTNNLYLEIAVGAGLDALLAWLTLVLLAAAGAWRVLVEATSTTSTTSATSATSATSTDSAQISDTAAASLAAVGAIAAFSVHGLVDAPLFFYANAGLFAVMAGVGLGGRWR